jgi:hypothetical protein
LERQSDAEGVVRCDECNTPIAELKDRGWERLRAFAFDHVLERAMGGKTMVGNGRAICDGPKTCHAIKSAKRQAVIAKCKRLSGETLSQYERRKRFGPSLKGNSSFQRRGR